MYKRQILFATISTYGLQYFFLLGEDVIGFINIVLAIGVGYFTCFLPVFLSLLTIGGRDCDKHKRRLTNRRGFDIQTVYILPTSWSTSGNLDYQYHSYNADLFNSTNLLGKMVRQCTAYIVHTGMALVFVILNIIRISQDPVLYNIGDYLRSNTTNNETVVNNATKIILNPQTDLATTTFPSDVSTARLNLIIICLLYTSPSPRD